MEIEYDGFRPRRHAADVEPLRSLRAISAGLFIVTGIETAAGARRGDPQPTRGLRAVPTVIAPIAVAAHVVHALRPTPRSGRLALLTDGLAMAAGAAGLAASVLASVDDDRERRGMGLLPRRRSSRLPSLTPLAFALTGALGYVVASRERERAADVDRLAAAERRARIVERLVPRRRGKRDRFVIRM